MTIKKDDISFYIKVKNDNFNIFDYEPEKVKKIICITKNNKIITLLDCSIAPTTNHMIQFQVIYNLMIIGLDVDSLDELMTRNFHAILRCKKLDYKLWIGKNSFTIDNLVKVQSKWNKEKIGNKYKIFGVEISFKVLKVKSYSYFIDTFFKLLMVYSFYIGYFPDEIEFYFYLKNKKIEIINPNKSVYRTSNRNIIIDKVLNLKNPNFTIAYDKFNKLYDNNKILFNVYFSINYNEDNFDEIKTFNYIQCLESFYTNVIKYKKTNTQNIKKDFLVYLKSEMDNEESIIRNKIKEVSIFNEKFSEISNFLTAEIKSMGNVSLNALLKIILKSDIARLIFKFEFDNGLFNRIQSKMYNHRNLLAHINKNSNYFFKLQNSLMQKKLDLLFRILVLNYISLEINQDSLVDYINYINNNFYKKINNIALSQNKNVLLEFWNL